MSKKAKPAYHRVMAASLLAAALPMAGLAQGALQPLPADLLEVDYESIESDGADRIVLASKLRTLTQQVAAASCSVTSHIDVDEAHDVLIQATSDFDRFVLALRDGDLDLHILGPEEDARIVRDIDHVSAEWGTIHGAVDTVIADEGAVDAAHIIDDHNLPLLELTSILSADISARYAHPYEMTASDALMIEIAGRQLMLTQKMAKDACEVWTGYHADTAREDLAETVAVFETSLKALRFGMPEAGLDAAPTDQIREDLDILLERWEVIKVNEQVLIDGGELNEAQKTEIFHDLQLELADLEHLLHDYKDYSERAH